MPVNSPEFTPFALGIGSKFIPVIVTTVSPVVGEILVMTGRICGDMRERTPACDIVASIRPVRPASPVFSRRVQGANSPSKILEFMSFLLYQ